MSVVHHAIDQEAPDQPAKWWTADDVLALPENDTRYEAVEGALIVNPPPSLGHQDASFLLHLMLRTAVREADAAYRIWEAVGIRLPHNQLLIPDLVVAHAGRTPEPGAQLDAGDAELVVEIVSPGSTTRDRAEKPILYAEAGIRYFWRVELGHFKGRTEPLPVILAYELAGDQYALTNPQIGAGNLLELNRPFPIKLDPANLVER